ncbi:MAG: hypothetical protein BGO67_02780 [Alphaproteobacteria bacterium 41-28]|nr:MAG: hypothetical protein BGO67_02780 [Alphaproteobacteria bacterium 41-28]
MYKIIKLFCVSDVTVLRWIRKEEDIIEYIPSHDENKIVMINVVLPQLKDTKSRYKRLMIVTITQ